MFDFENYYRVKIDDTIDGDTVRLSFYLGLGIWLNDQSVRLLGINTPEIRGEEKVLGLRVKEFLKTKLAESTVVVARTDEDKKGKYGRFLVVLNAKIKGAWVNLNRLLLEEGAAEEYMIASEKVELQKEIFDPNEADIEKRLVVDEKRTEEEVYGDEMEERIARRLTMDIVANRLTWERMAA